MHARELIAEQTIVVVAADRGRVEVLFLIVGLLHSRTYHGQLKHPEQYVESTGPAIIDKALWDEAHALLQINGRVRSASSRGKVDFLLKGLLTGPNGRALSP